MSDEPTPITPDPRAEPPRHHSRGFWRRDALIWGAVIVLVVAIAAWRLSTTGRGPEDASRYHPAAGPETATGETPTAVPPPAPQR